MGVSVGLAVAPLDAEPVWLRPIVLDAEPVWLGVFVPERVLVIVGESVAEPVAALEEEVDAPRDRALLGEGVLDGEGAGVGPSGLLSAQFNPSEAELLLAVELDAASRA